MTKLVYRRPKSGRIVKGRKKDWKARSVVEINQDLEIISVAWEGTREDREAWGILKRELKVATLEEARLKEKEERKQAEGLIDQIKAS
jgi:hypothetical protein